MALFSLKKEYVSRGAKKASFPVGVKPALAQLVAKPFDSEGHVFEIKFDGVRVIAYKKGKSVQLFSRNGQNLNATFPEIVAGVASLKPKNLVIDGEVAAIKKSKILGFQDVQPRLGVGDQDEIIELMRKHPVAFFVFDVVHVEGFDVTRMPLLSRKRILSEIIPKKGVVQFVPSFEKSGKKLFALAVKKGFEGIIAKDRNGIYSQGVRAWQKMKSTHEQEFIVCGWTEGQGARQNVFGALILGTHDPKTKKLIHMGNVGTGFDDEMLRDLMKKFRRFEQKSSPFSEDEDVFAPSKKHWMRLRHVVQVRYAEITHDHKLRKPVYLGLRIDKKPSEVILEQPK